ncbi:peroxidase A2 isoform X2 [Zea mays]|uniref:Peroxidase n=2 Tax=Zea mays TaxID=4577 RepID=A0A1D6JVC3_MAIZE|nr:peroxidase A2 isoform X2 [Zea mays]ONL95747.1 Peroxidase 53 [Zea mays]|eukprot:XP_008653195.1 peroxidase A2 isoform X2 [Zea mays]
MAFPTAMAAVAVALCAAFALAALGGAEAQQLSPAYYDDSCPHVYDTVRRVIQEARASDPRILASLLRLHFHDCFVNGCDASLLLDETPTMRSEKEANPNKGSARGFPVVDDIKAALENACPGVVSCADVLALAAEVSVELAGGPYWRVMLGRTDGMAANFDGAQNLPNPTEPLNDLKQKFADLGLDDTDFVALQGAHTIGRAQCRFFQDRLYNFSDTERSDPTLDRSYLAALRESCPAAVSDNTCLNNLDPATPDTFDNRYYANILSNRGLLRSDQAMLSAPEEGAVSTAPIVGRFANSQVEFFQSFATAMVKMGNIAPMTGGLREVRRNCRVVN